MKLNKLQTKRFDKALKLMNIALSAFMEESPTDYEILEPFIGAEKANLVTDSIIKYHKEQEAKWRKEVEEREATPIPELTEEMLDTIRTAKNRELGHDAYKRILNIYFLHPNKDKMKLQRFIDTAWDTYLETWRKDD